MKLLTSLGLVEPMSRVANMLLNGAVIVDSTGGDQSNSTKRRKLKINISLAAHRDAGHISVATMMAMQDPHKGDTRGI